jgi:hypothetical protein
MTPDIARGIKATAGALGIDPRVLGAAISYETAGTFDPVKKGPTTKWGTHRGLIQFGEPQAKKYGVDWNDPIGSQLGPDGAVARYLRDTGVKPGMGLMDVYSAINAGGVGRYNRSDAHAGGAPGTVADKVNNQMAGHWKKAAALLGGDYQIVPASYQPPQQKEASPMRNLLGFQSPYTPETTQLLGLDPKEMRRQALFAGLAQAGARLAETGTLGGAVGGFAEGVNQGRQGYMDERLMGFQMQQGAEDRAMRQEDRQWQLGERQRQSEERRRQEEARQKWLANPNDQGAFAQAYPDEYARQYSQTLFPSPEPPYTPKSYAPIPYDMGDGQIGYGIPMEDGSFRPVETPEGAQFLSPFEKAYQTNAGATRGKTVTEQQLSAPSDIAAADQALDLIRQIERHPGIDRGTGFTALGNVVPGTLGYDFQNLVEQTKSGAFLTAIDQLRGMGALSNMEGQAATAAITRINTATSKEAFLKALDDYRKIVETARERAIRRVPGQVAPQPQVQPQPMQQGEPSVDDLLRKHGG